MPGLATVILIICVVATQGAARECRTVISPGVTIAYCADAKRVLESLATRRLRLTVLCPQGGTDV